MRYIRTFDLKTVSTKICILVMCKSYAFQTYLSIIMRYTHWNCIRVQNAQFTLSCEPNVFQTDLFCNCLHTPTGVGFFLAYLAIYVSGNIASVLYNHVASVMTNDTVCVLYYSTHWLNMKEAEALIYTTTLKSVTKIYPVVVLVHNQVSGNRFRTLAGSFKPLFAVCWGGWVTDGAGWIALPNPKFAMAPTLDTELTKPPIPPIENPWCCIYGSWKSSVHFN